MSQYEYKMVLRAYNENISSKREHLAWMRQITGKEPERLEGEDPDDKRTPHFSYMPLNGNGTRKQHFSTGPPSHAYFCDVSDGELYGADLVIAWTVGESLNVSLGTREMGRMMTKMCNTTGVSPDQVSYVFYGWWNGGDEPIEW